MRSKKKNFNNKKKSEIRFRKMESDSLLTKPKGKDLVKKLLIVSTGLCCDAYFLFQMNIITVVLKSIYENRYITMYESLISGSILFGAIFGQLLFGFLGDKYGRLKMFVWTLVIMVFLCIVSSFAFDTQHQNDSLYVWIAISRFFLGIGIGGE
jgi:MFS transporter, PHS family, inorganic phosphate transporter